MGHILVNQFMNSVGEVTALLRTLQSGDQSASERLLDLVYRELRRLAAARMRSERASHTLTPTELVHEAYLRLQNGQQIGYVSRAHFFAIASQAMRRVLVDYARARVTAKRHGEHVPLEDGLHGIAVPDAELIALDEALTMLEAMCPRQRQVVELRYFAGLPEHEVAAVLGVTRRTVNRDWQIARAWLYGRLRGATD